ncbi:hypothetical protein DFH09DRAFT_1331988 [Mycena vulgaris]|nr:hypothetical protein DFH09DRAFT_1331988 [Mycena vulgaris]
MAAPRGLRNAVVMIQSSGPSFRQFAELNRELVPTLVYSRFWPLLIAQNTEESSGHLSGVIFCYQLKETLYRAIHTLNLWTAEKPSLWLDVMHQELSPTTRSVPSHFSSLHNGESYEIFRAWLLDPSARMSGLKYFVIDSHYRMSLTTTQARADTAADVKDLSALILANMLDSPSRFSPHCCICYHEAHL